MTFGFMCFSCTPRAKRQSFQSRASVPWEFWALDYLTFEVGVCALFSNFMRTKCLTHGICSNKWINDEVLIIEEWVGYLEYEFIPYKEPYGL